MKRGRKNIRNQVQISVLEILGENRSGLNIESLRSRISIKFNHEVSWNTVQKYIQELVEINKIQPTILPHSKDQTKEGLTLYTLKKQVI